LVAVFIISWIVVLGAETPDQKQAELIRQAGDYMGDGIYVLAAPLLEEAIDINASRTVEAENMLKRAYLEMMGQTGVSRKYLDLLDKQMGRGDAGPEAFAEAAGFHLDRSRFAEAYAVLRAGIAKTQSRELSAMYEGSRYEYTTGYNAYEDVTRTFGSTIGVCRDGRWGIARADGTLFIPCEYDKVSTFSDDRAVVKNGALIYAVDRNNNRLALSKANASDFGNLANDRVPLLIDGKWYRATGEFVVGSTAFDWIGTYSGGYAAAQLNGKWGVVDLSVNWIVPPEYDGVATDELGRSYAQGAVFVKRGGAAYLFVDGAQTGEAYEDACPFGSEGYAAVKKNGKWGFIDVSGEVKIDFRFDEALSFGQHLAAVRQGELWGYVSLYGVLVIDPVFLQAKSFSNGSAPVLTDIGWRFITLIEYRAEGGLM